MLSFAFATFLAAPPDPVALYAEECRAAFGVPGLVVVVVKDDALVAQVAVGRLHPGGDPATPDTLFPLASCTKSFTTALVASLAGDGQLSWDDPVRKHQPDFRLPDPAADALVSLRDLACHRTGVGGHDLLWYAAPWNLDETLKRNAKLPLERPFRGGFMYSSTMVAVLGRAAAARAGSPWEELVRTRITAPLGMAGVRFTSPEPRPTGNVRRGGDVVPMPAQPAKEPNPAGSMFATPRDMLPWLRCLVAGGTLDGKRVLPEGELAEAMRPHVPMPMDAAARRYYPRTVQMNYALGWVSYDYRGLRVVAHGGMIDGFRVLVHLVPSERLGIAVFGNLHASQANQMLANRITDDLAKLPPLDWNAIGRAAEKADADDKAAAATARAAARRADVLPALPIASYAGDYADPAYGTGRISVVNGRLEWAWSSFRVPLEPWDGETFRMIGGFFDDQFLEFRVRRGAADAVRFQNRVFDRK